MEYLRFTYRITRNALRPRFNKICITILKILYVLRFNTVILLQFDVSNILLTMYLLQKDEESTPPSLELTVACIHTVSLLQWTISTVHSPVKFDCIL